MFCGPGEVKEADEGCTVITAQTLVDVLIQPTEEQ
jgi:hypothetical protein